MSGHSKWANIKDRKTAQDKKRGASFTKLLRGVQVAAQSGSDADINPALSTAIEAAKRGGVSKDTIDRAIKRGSGEDKDVSRMETVVYEGYGPGKVAILVECVTDNKNRASSDVKHAFSKYGGSFGGAGSVQWMFERKAVVHIGADVLDAVSLDELQLAFMDAGAQDMDESDGLYVSATPDAYAALFSVCKRLHINPAFSGLVWQAKDTMDVSAEDRQQLQTMLEAFDALDDVSEVYTNVV